MIEQAACERPRRKQLSSSSATPKTDTVSKEPHPIANAQFTPHADKSDFGCIQSERVIPAFAAATCVILAAMVNFLSEASDLQARSFSQALDIDHVSTSNGVKFSMRPPSRGLELLACKMRPPACSKWLAEHDAASVIAAVGASARQQARYVLQDAEFRSAVRVAAETGLTPLTPWLAWRFLTLMVNKFGRDEASSMEGECLLAQTDAPTEQRPASDVGASLDSGTFIASNSLWQQISFGDDPPRSSSCSGA